MTVDLLKLKEKYHLLFITPFASHHWASKRGRSHWVELEGWQDSLAGPLSAIAGSGGCEYVYSRDDSYFAAVHDPASLRLQLLERHDGLATGVEQFIPATPGETVDVEFMRSVVSKLRGLIDRACAVEQQRWERRE